MHPSDTPYRHSKSVLSTNPPGFSIPDSTLDSTRLGLTQLGLTRIWACLGPGPWLSQLLVMASLSYCQAARDLVTPSACLHLVRPWPHRETRQSLTAHSPDSRFSAIRPCSLRANTLSEPMLSPSQCFLWANVPSTQQSSFCHHPEPWCEYFFVCYRSCFFQHFELRIKNSRLPPPVKNLPNKDLWTSYCIIVLNYGLHIAFVENANILTKRL